MDIVESDPGGDVHVSQRRRECYALEELGEDPGERAGINVADFVLCRDEARAVPSGGRARVATMIGLLTEWHGWEWAGWSALVALGTILLAAATAFLGWETRDVAKAAEDEQAARWRPILVGVGPPRNEDRVLSVDVKNDGPGPALRVEVRTDRTVLFDANAGPMSGDAPLYVVPVAQTKTFRFAQAGYLHFTMKPEIELRYSDIAGNHFTSLLALNLRKDEIDTTVNRSSS